MILELSAGQFSDHRGAAMVLDELPTASNLIADRGHESAWFREALIRKSIEPCIPSSRSRKMPFPCDKAIYRQRHRVENFFAKLKDGGIAAVRSMRAHLLLGNLHRRNNHRLDMTNEARPWFAKPLRTSLRRRPQTSKTLEFQTPSPRAREVGCCWIQWQEMARSSPCRSMQAGADLFSLRFFRRCEVTGMSSGCHTPAIGGGARRLP